MISEENPFVADKGFVISKPVRTIRIIAFILGRLKQVAQPYRRCSENTA